MLLRSVALGSHALCRFHAPRKLCSITDANYLQWFATVTRTPATLLQLDLGNIAIGGSADLMLFRGRGMSELLSRPQCDRVVLRQGRAIETALPDHR